MAVQCDELMKGPARQNLFEVHGDGNALQKFLGIHPPDDASNTPPILAFRRKREVEIPWSEIVSDEDVTGATSIAAIREYLEDSWGSHVDKEWMTDKAHQLLDTGSGSWRVKQLQTGEPPSIFRPDFENLDGKGNPTPVPISEGFVIRHGPGDNGRLYLLINDNKTLSPEHFKSFDMYNSAWENEIDGVELVFESPEDAQLYYMDFEEIDLRPALIQKKYEELRILHEFAKKVKENVAGVTEKLINQITATTLDADELEKLQRKVLRLEIGEYDVRRRIERLASDAARLGYLLFIEDTEKEITYPDKTTMMLAPGKLYTRYRRTARWTEYESRYVRVKVGRWIFKRTKRREVKYPVPKEQVVERYNPVDTSREILAETRSAMIKNNQKVYVFEQTPSGLVSTEGEALHQIMGRCKYDEAFRRVCVVMLPVYEESLTGQRLVAKYAVYKRPLPGLVPTILPRLSLEESLTYRTAWVQTQLGELLNSINLAPDEERKVTITKRFEQETTVSRTSTSIFDISRAETSDLATEMESQTRQEQENSKSMQFSTKASGGYGPFSAEASASGGTTSSLKDMSQAINKVARQAAKSVSSQNREEVSSTTSARTTISNTDETVATIRNINQGRSLNLMFYRLYNKYKGGLFLEGLRFDVIQSVEVIAGSGVHESKSYSLEELPHLIAEFKAARLPFPINNEDEYTRRLIESIKTLLDTEYKADGVDDAPKAAAGRTAEKPSTEAASVSVARLSFPSPVKRKVTLKAGLSDADSRLAELSDGLREAYIHSDKPIAPQELLVAAPGLYLDAAVGAQPSTEPYSEAMRAQEVNMRAAEVFVKESEGVYQRAMAMRLAQMKFGEGGNYLTGLLPDLAKGTLTLSLRMPLAPGDWRLIVGGEEKEAVDLKKIGLNVVQFDWHEAPEWLSTADLINQVRLFNNESGGTIGYPV